MSDDLGINLSFAVKRWPEPERWVDIVRRQLDLTNVQFTFDLLDPWTPDRERSRMATRIREVAASGDVRIASAFVGLAAYTFNGLLHPDSDARAAAERWWEHAIDLTAELGATAIGGPLGAMSVADAQEESIRAIRYADLLAALGRLTERARAAGLDEWLIEITPLPREIPHRVDEAIGLLVAVNEQAALPVRYVLDVGHVAYRPLYGPEATVEPWLAVLGTDIGLVHLQNHDYHADAH